MKKAFFIFVILLILISGCKQEISNGEVKDSASDCNKINFEIDHVYCAGDKVRLISKSDQRIDAFNFEVDGNLIEAKEGLGPFQDNIWKHIEGSSTSNKLKAIPKLIKTVNRETGERTYEICENQAEIFTILRRKTRMYDLSEYPQPFFSDSIEKDTVGIYGTIAKSPISDRLALTDIFSIFKNELLISPMFEDTIENTEACNLIVVGTMDQPCDKINKLITKLTGFDCNNWPYSEGQGIIKIVKNGDNIALIAAGTTVKDTRQLATILKNYKDYGLTGSEFVYTG